MGVGGPQASSLLGDKNPLVGELLRFLQSDHSLFTIGDLNNRWMQYKLAAKKLTHCFGSDETTTGDCQPIILLRWPRQGFFGGP